MRITSILNLIVALMVTGSCATVSLPTLQEATTCTLTGPRLTLGHRTSVRQTGFSFTFGRHARLTGVAMACATSRIDGLDFHSWQAQRRYIKLQSQRMLDLGYYQRRELMLRRCLPTRSYLYPSTIHFSSNQYRTVWRDQRRRSLTKSRRGNSPVNRSLRQNRRSTWGTGSTLLSTGRTQETTRMMEKNYDY